MKLDPKLFIYKPYTPCPKCRKVTFGILMIHNTSYTKQCYQCMYSESYKVPPIHKKLIYLDQFVISNIMNSLDKESSKYLKLSKDRYWKDLYIVLSRLIQAQVIICPYSRYHFKESLSTPVYDKLKRIYKHLSYGKQLESHNNVFNLQVCNKFEEYLSGNTLNDDISIIQEDYNKWEDRLQIEVDFRLSKDDTDAILKENIEMYKGFIEIAENNWKSNPKTLEGGYEEEIQNYGPAVVQNYIRQCSEYGETTFIPGSLQLLFSYLLSIARKYKIPEENQRDMINSFLTSGVMREIPYVYNACYMFAALRQKVQSGMKISNISQGMNTDITAISSYLPYMDAMFIDNEQANYIQELTKQKKFHYNCQIFSTRTRVNFLKYLEKIERSTPKSHFTLVDKIYGTNWTKPYLTILEK